MEVLLFSLLPAPPTALRARKNPESPAVLFPALAPFSSLEYRRNV